MVSESLTARD